MVWGNEGFHHRVKRMDDSLAGVVLAAGAGRRLAPLTWLRPKALCPVAGRPLVDHALDRLGRATGRLAVNLHHGADALDAHLPPDVHRSFERPEALGTAGALGAMRAWIAGRDVLVTNADAWLDAPDLGAFVAGWDRTCTRLLTVHEPARGDFGELRYCGVALIPAATASAFAASPSGLYEVSWRGLAERGELDLVIHPGGFIDCGTPRDYLAANLAASGGEAVIDPRARIGAGAVIERSVVWDDAEVAAGEVLRDAVRAGRWTVLVR